MKEIKYLEDTTGKRRNKLEHYWLDVIEKQDGDESVPMVKPKENTFHYHKHIDTTPTEEDSYNAVEEYTGWKAGVFWGCWKPC